MLTVCVALIPLLALVAGGKIKVSLIIADKYSYIYMIYCRSLTGLVNWQDALLHLLKKNCHGGVLLNWQGNLCYYSF